MQSRCRFDNVKCRYDGEVGIMTLRRIFPISLCLVALLLLIPAGFAMAEDNPFSYQLKVALLPLPDVLPFWVASEKGYFSRQKLEVKPIPVISPIDRDQLMQSGEIDGMLTELVTVASFNRERTRVKIVTVARKPQDGHSLFSIIAAPGSGIRKALDLKQVPIGVSKNTVIEYLTERLLSSSGLSGDDIKTASVPVIPERYQLLLQGRLKAATLPEPLASSAVAAGALTVVSDRSNPMYSISVIAFSEESLQTKSTAVSGFVKAWDAAVADINRNPESFREIMLQKIRVPNNVAESYAIPSYPRVGPPNRNQWEDAIDWMISKTLLDLPVSYDESVTAAFIPVP